MRLMACAAAALMFAFTAACNDRDRQDTGTRIDNAAEEAGRDVREGAEDVEGAAEDATEDVGNAAEDAVNDADAYSYERREEFRSDVRARLDRMDGELAEFERASKAEAGEARRDAVAAARDARQAVDRNVERLDDATADNWSEVRLRVSESLDSAERALRALRPDAKPMGGTGGPE